MGSATHCKWRYRSVSHLIIRFTIIIYIWIIYYTHVKRKKTIVHCIIWVIDHCFPCTWLYLCKLSYLTTICFYSGTNPDSPVTYQLSRGNCAPILNWKAPPSGFNPRELISEWCKLRNLIVSLLFLSHKQKKILYSTWDTALIPLPLFTINNLELLLMFLLFVRVTHRRHFNWLVLLQDCEDALFQQ